MSTDHHLPGNSDYEESDYEDIIRSAIQGISRELRVTNQIMYLDKLGHTASEKERKEIVKDIRRGLGLIGWLRPGDPGYEDQPVM